jgi:hypothetical protein
MTKQMLRTLVLAVGALALYGTVARATPYYLFDGDSRHAVEIEAGAVVNSFTIPAGAYPVAITDTIWLGGRDNNGGYQFPLDGVGPVATSVGGPIITQILDGTTNGVNNYGVTCCSGPPSVTVADLDWSNQKILFSIDAAGGDGIAFDTASNSLYVGSFDGEVTNYSLTGHVLGQFGVTGEVVGLAYEQSTDTLWGWNVSVSSLQQFSLTGTVLQTQAIDLTPYGFIDPFGGEMPIAAVSSGSVPEISTWALTLVGFGAAGAALRRSRRRLAAAAV